MNLIFISRFLAAIAAAWIVYFWGGSYLPAQAEVESVIEDGSVVINMPVYGQVTYSDLAAEAESLAEEAIARQFTQNPSLPTVRVVVLSNRNGEMIPILTTTVSREQWQANPQVSAWTQYYASYGLIQRHGERDTVAIAPGGSPPNGLNNRNAISRSRSSQIDEAFDEGRLTGRAAQDYLSDLD
ncbi:MAG: hypothetical protein VKK04_24780 [Synechococcales bacterium]|nr:hypothetical protein [Synechococcales bacterium]